MVKVNLVNNSPFIRLDRFTTIQYTSKQDCINCKVQNNNDISQNTISREIITAIICTTYFGYKIYYKDKDNNTVGSFRISVEKVENNKNM